MNHAAGLSRADGIALLLNGETPYEPARALQHEIWARRHRLELPDTLILLEHEPVITLGRNGDPAHLRAGEGMPPVVRIARGGEVTYHGPGQITGYLISDLRAHNVGVRAFIERLEDALIDLLADFGLRCHRRAGLVGIWTAPDESGAKIAAIGVRISRGISYHGFALNVGDCLDGFHWMVPCGLAGAEVTSIERMLGRRIDLHSVRGALVQKLGERFGIDFRSVVAERGDVPLAALERAAARGARKPAWLKIALPRGRTHTKVRETLISGKLCTVCEEARCPNRQECWDAGTATFMILGNVCTRRCRFCAVAKGGPAPPDRAEPARVGMATRALGLKHVVVTSVTRDDLPDGGAAHFAETIRQIRAASPEATVEVLVPDFAGSRTALEIVLAERPDVLNHNVETAARLYGIVRAGADYRRSLELLRAAADAGLSAKSGFMIGLGESEHEIRMLLEDLHAAGCDLVTIGQYLQPNRMCLPVKRYWTPAEFEAWSAFARALGIRSAQAGPLVRSSYHAAEALQRA